MDLITKHEISLDLARNNYVAIRLKQYDKNSRKIVITITHNGAEYKLDNTIKAFLQVKKSDGTATADDCIVDVANNKVIATVREQMSAASGVCYADLSLYNTAKKQTLGTMKFNLVFDSSAVTRADVVSSTEFNTLADLVVIGAEKIDNLNQLIEKSDTQLSTFNSAEETRKKNETSRVTAEKSRVTAEASRASAETLRDKAETARISAESTRNKSETTRVSNENTRIDAENNRVNSETDRTTAESERASSEYSRVNAESVRATAESNRAIAESKRVTAENSRVTDETARVQNETARKDAEAKRVTAEASRASAETLRATAESSRVLAESSRSSVEEKRVSAENSRVNAETARVNAENSRVVAEKERQTNTSNAVKGCNDIESTLRTKLSNGEFDGKTMLYGDGVPASSLGKLGDMYIDVKGVDPNPHYLYVKESAGWSPKWGMRGLNGTVVNNVDIDSTASAPSVNAVKTALKGKANVEHNHNKLKYVDLTGQTVSLNNINLSNGVTNVIYYYCKTDSGGANITGRPNDANKNAFNLKVELIRWASTTDYITKQTYTIGVYKQAFIRYCVSGKWSEWEKVYTSVQKPTPADIGAAASSHNHSASNITSGTLPIARGGTGATTAAGVLTNLGITATAAELNKLDGILYNVQEVLNCALFKIAEDDDSVTYGNLSEWIEAGKPKF